MASGSAEIAVGASNYRGDVGLGGGTFGSFQLDVKPIEDLARYTMLYNRAEYEQRQKDAERAAAEIADYTSYDLTSGIPKDAKLLQEKYDKLTAYVRDNPNALDYRNKKEWAEYKKMRNDLENDLVGGKVRNTMWALRQKEIQDQTDPKLRKLMQDELDAEIAATDIRTPIKHSQAFADQTIKLPDATELTFDVVKTGPNATVIRDFKVWNVPRSRANSDVFALGLDETADLSTPEGQRQAIARKNNFFLQGAEAVNSVINTKDPNGVFLYKKEVTDAAGNKTFVLDETKMSKMPRSLINLVKETNDYLTQTKAEIKAGVYLDKFEKPITFGPGALNEEDYAEINYNDGISPEELALVAQYAKWKGDTYTTKVQQTDNEIQKRGQDISAATARRGQDLDYKVAWHNANKPSGGAGSKTVSGGIQTPAILFGEHVNRVKNFYASKKTGELTVPLAALDDKTIEALNINDVSFLSKEASESEKKKEEKRVVYRPDGGFIIQIKSGKDWENARAGTIEDLKQGFIDVVKRGTTQTEGFQDESEKGFNGIFGTTSGSVIFNGWGAKPTTTANPANPGKTETPEERAKRIANE